MSDTTPERTVPAEVEQAIVNHHSAVLSYGRGTGDVNTVVTTTRALYAAVVAALEPDRALRERAERLRMVIVDLAWDAGIEPVGIFPDSYDKRIKRLLSGDLDDDLTATSSANVRRE